MKMFLIALLMCVAAIGTLAQNADVNAERVSMDMQLLQSIMGEHPIGAAGVWPQSVTALRQQAAYTTSKFGLYVKDYYGHVLPGTDTTGGMLFAATDSRFRALSLADGSVRLQGDAALMMRSGYYNNGTVADPYMLAQPAVRFMGSLDEHVGFFLDLSNGMRLAGNSAFIAMTDPALARVAKFTTEDSSFFDRYVGYVQYQGEHLRIRFGREPLQYGYSPVDNLVHSIDAPLLDGLLIDVPYKSFRFTATHSTANGTDTSGVAVPGKFVATHRLAFDPVSWLSLAVNDMIVYWGRGLDLAYLNPLAFFVSTGLSTDDRSRHDNSMISFDFALRPMNGTLVYGTWFVDDLNYSTISDTSYLGNTNKWAWQLGVSHVLGNTASFPSSLATIEYVKIDPFVYSHRTNQAVYSSFGGPLGYSMQPNSDRLAMQWRTWFTPRTFVRVDLDYTRHGENILDSSGQVLMGPNPHFPNAMSPIGNVGGDMFRGDGDDLQGNRFLRGNISYQRRVRLWFSAEWWHNIFTDVRIGYTNRNGGNTPGNFFFGSLEVRVGY